LRHVTEASPVTGFGGFPDIWVTLSIGVSMGGRSDQTSMTVDKIYDRADQALLGAKSQGKNQVIFSQPSP
jgi:GGDEF domain-containing protein